MSTWKQEHIFFFYSQFTHQSFPFSLSDKYIITWSIKNIPYFFVILNPSVKPKKVLPASGLGSEEKERDKSDASWLKTFVIVLACFFSFSFFLLPPNTAAVTLLNYVLLSALPFIDQQYRNRSVFYSNSTVLYKNPMFSQSEKEEKIFSLACYNLFIWKPACC